MLGDINRAPQINIQVNQQFNDFMNVILSEVNEVDRGSEGLNTSEVF